MERNPRLVILSVGVTLVIAVLVVAAFLLGRSSAPSAEPSGEGREIASTKEQDRALAKQWKNAAQYASQACSSLTRVNPNEAWPGNLLKGQIATSQSFAGNAARLDERWVSLQYAMDKVYVSGLAQEIAADAERRGFNNGLPGQLVPLVVYVPRAVVLECERAGVNRASWQQFGLSG